MKPGRLELYPADKDTKQGKITDKTVLRDIPISVILEKTVQQSKIS